MFWFLKKFHFFIYIHIGEMKINFEVDTKEYWSMYGYTIYAIAPLPMYTSFFLKSFIPCDLHLFICRDSSNTYSISSYLKSQERKISYSKTSYGIYRYFLLALRTRFGFESGWLAHYSQSPRRTYLSKND